MWIGLQSWINPPVFEGEEDKTRAANLLNVILWVFIFASAAYGLFAPIETVMRWRRATIIVPFIIFLLGLRYALNRGHVRIVGWLTVSLLWIMFTSAMLFGADYKNPAFMGYVIVVICAGLLLHWRAAIGWSVFSIFTTAIILNLANKGILPGSDGTTPPFAFWAAQSMYILVASVLISQTLRKIDQALAKAQIELAERRRVEAEREKIIKELGEKNAELERFTYTVSHDLKSPLITIGGFIGLLEKDIRTNDIAKISNAIERIREAKDKMSYLLDDLLELSRIGRLKNPSTNVNLREIVDEALGLVHGQLTTNNIQVQIQEPLPTLYCDGPRLVEVIQNLVDNAAKFMGKQPNPLIEIGTRNTTEEVVIFVKDNGIGIKPAFHEKIFSLFDKLEANSEGTGVGLALVKRIIEIHEGRIWVESDGLGNGSTFCFVLPNTKF